MIIISYYTKNTPYQEVMQTHLLPSIKLWKLDHDIEAISNLGNWSKNTHYKAEFIKKMLLKHKQSVVFLDADATIKKFPKLLFELENHDIGVHYLDWELQWRKKKGTNLKTLSGTLYINYTSNALKFLDEWIKQNKINVQWEQRNMQIILDKSKYLNIYKLPYSYIVIKLHDNQLPLHMIKKEEVIILHHQVSRKYKNWREK